VTQADRDEIVDVRDALNRAGTSAPKYVSDLALPYVPGALQRLNRIAQDEESRQSRQACVDILNFYLAGASEGSSGGSSDVKVVVVNASDIQKLGEMQRQAILAEKTK
jgi:hypothetical protein